MCVGPWVTIIFILWFELVESIIQCVRFDWV